MLEKSFHNFRHVFEGFLKVLSRKSHAKGHNGVADFSQLDLEVDWKMSVIKR